MGRKPSPGKQTKRGNRGKNYGSKDSSAYYKLSKKRRDSIKKKVESATRQQAKKEIEDE